MDKVDFKLQLTSLPVQLSHPMGPWPRQEWTKMQRIRKMTPLYYQTKHIVFEFDKSYSSQPNACL